MNVYEIGPYVIAAESADHAFGVYLEATNDLDGLVFDALEEGQEHEVTIIIKRLKSAQIASKQIECCGPFDSDCKFCEGLNGPVYRSYQDFMDDRKQSDFPCVIAQEI